MPIPISDRAKLDKEIIEYERLADMSLEDVSVLNDLSRLYKEQERYEDQILIFGKDSQYG